jgi:coproporphyrinogen III oxidase-like Fe-S oxidoreductase
LSCYQLTLEPNTYFAKFPPKGIPDDDVLSDMSDLVRDKTAARGFDHYEVSAYAKGEYRCRHNLNYWEFGDYFAVGPGAHGKITIQGRPERFYNYRDPARWLLSFKEHQTQIAERKLIDPEDLPFEFMLNALRLREGVPFDFYTERTGLDFDVIESIWTELREKGLVCDHLKRIKTTEKGWLFLNEVLEAFL